MFGVDDLFLATFAEAAPEMFGAAEAGAGALGAAETLGTLGELGTAGTTAAMQGGFGSGLASAAASNPELLDPNVLARLTEEKALNSGIMSQGVNPDFVNSVNSYRPTVTSMFGPDSEQYAQAASNTATDAGGGNSPYVNRFLDPVQSGAVTPPATGSAGNTPYTNTTMGPGPSHLFNPLAATPPTSPEALQTSNMEAYPSAVQAPQAIDSRSALEKGWDTATAWAEKHPFQTAGAAYLGASKLGLLDQKGMDPTAPYSGPLSKYHLSPDFQGRHANPADYQYTPKRYNMASGGIAQIPSYAKGSTVDISQYTDMVDPKYKELPVYHGEIATDNDPNTRFQDPMTAAITRMQQARARANMQGPTLAKPTPMGQLNLAPANAGAKGNPMDISNYAQGGIAGYSVGGVLTPYELIQQRIAQNTNAPITNQQNSGTQSGTRSGDMPPMSDATKQFFDNEEKTPGARDARMQKVQDIMNMVIPGGMLINGLRSMGILGAGNPEPTTGNPVYSNTSTIDQKPEAGGPMSYTDSSTKTISQAESPDGDGGTTSAARGGIMGHSNLGSYAAGGNPRLLRGPGDGMSDNIPATIDNSQPARLADGEFVVPADVVSHLGNGSTEAGAKKLHEMMTHVRQARTGNPKQGKQIDPNRFMPK